MLSQRLCSRTSLGEEERDGGYQDHHFPHRGPQGDRIEYCIDAFSVVDPNALNLDPYPGFWPNFGPESRVIVPINCVKIYHFYIRMKIMAPEEI